jgi:hypothetical protein
MTCSRRAATCLAVLLLLAPPLLALPPEQAGNTDRTEVIRNLVVQPGEGVGDVVCLGCSIRVLGHVHGDAVAVGGDIEIDGTLDGDAVAMGGAVRIGSSAAVSGDAIALGGPLQLSPQARVNGERTALAYVGFPGQRRLHLRAVVGLIGINLLGALLGLAICRRRRVAALAAYVVRRPAWTLLAGAGVFVLVCALYAGTVFLGPALPTVAVLLTVALVVTWMAGFAGVASWVADRISSGRGSIRAVSLGAVVIALLELIPLAGFLVCASAALLALGSAALTGFGRAPREPAPQTAAAAEPPAAPAGH